MPDRIQQVISFKKENFLNQEEIFRHTFENAAVGMAHVDRHGRFIKVNSKLAEITGYSKDELVQKTFQEITHPDDLEQDLQQVEALQKGSIHSYSMEKRYFRKDGSLLWIRLSGSAVYDSNGEIDVFIAVIEDISERKKSEEELRESEQRFKIAAAAARIGSYTRDLRTGIDYWSPEFLAIYGYTPEDTLPLKEGIPASVHPDDVEAVTAEARARFERKSDPEFNSEHRIVLPDGTVRWVNLRGRVDFDENNIPLRTYGIVMDVTNKKKAEESMLEVRRRQEFLLKLSDALGPLADPIEIEQTATRIAMEFFNADRCYYCEIEDDYYIINRDAFRNGLPSVAGKYKLSDFPAFKLLMEAGQPVAVSNTNTSDLLDEPLKQLCLKMSVTAFVDIPVSKNGKLVGILCLTNSTVRVWNQFEVELLNEIAERTWAAAERARTEKALRHKVEENEKLMDIMPAAVWISEDPQCNVIWGNRMANEFYEAQKDENVSANVSSERHFFKNGEPLQPEDLPMQKSARENKPVYNEAIDVLLPSGKWFHMHGSAIPLNDEQGNVRGSVAAFVDITNHIETERALRESEEKFRMMANNISQLAWMADNTGAIFWFNKRWLDYTGTTLEEVKDWGWTKMHHPEHLDRVLEKRKEAWEKGMPWEDTFPLKGKNGKYRWFLSRAVPIRNEQGNITRWFGTNTDITEQRRSERLLHKANELFENLLFIAAHDLKGPIANMFSAFYLMEHLPDNEKLKLLERFRDLANQLDKTVKGISNILQVHKSNEKAAAVIQFDNILNDLKIEFKDSLSEGNLFSDFSGKPSLRYLQPFLVSIMKNLISNALKYCRNDVPLEIKIQTRSYGPYTLLTVQDNGLGIDMEQYGDKLFSPFQRFNPDKAKGTGIGLYLIRSIIEKNGGYINVKSMPGKGTTFYCYLKEY